MDNYVAQIMARIFAINAEIQGMVAANDIDRLSCAMPTYDDGQFLRLSDKLEVCAENILKHRKETPGKGADR